MRGMTWPNCGDIDAELPCQERRVIVPVIFGIDFTITHEDKSFEELGECRDFRKGGKPEVREETSGSIANQIEGRGHLTKEALLKENKIRNLKKKFNIKIEYFGG